MHENKKRLKLAQCNTKSTPRLLENVLVPLKGQISRKRNSGFQWCPCRKLRDQASFSFFPEKDWAGGMKVDRSGRGLALIWRRQIQQLNRVSSEMASAIVDAYPSPKLLVQVCYG